MNVLFIDETHPILSSIFEKENWKIHVKNTVSKEKLAQELEIYDGIIIRSRFRLDADFLSNAKNLKFIGRPGSGLENIDLEYCKSKNIEIRFIEFMENDHANVKKGLYTKEIQDIIGQKYRFTKMDREGNSPSQSYILKDGYKFGIIEPHLDDFCKDCNRIRLTAEGYLIPCLYFEDALSIADAVKQKDITEATNILKKVLQNKPEKNKWGEDNDSSRAFYETGG